MDLVPRLGSQPSTNIVEAKCDNAQKRPEIRGKASDLIKCFVAE